MKTLGVGVDLEALFGVEFEGPVAGNAQQVDQAWQQTKCFKCKGSGKFTSWSGRIVGPCFTCNGKGIKTEKQVAERAARTSAIDVTRITLALNTAFSKGKKRPHLFLGDLTFSRAPDTGKNPGAVYVKRGEQYLGKCIGSEFQCTRECDEATKATIVQIAADPHAAAVAHGKETIRCSCCGIELENPESRRLGIGPICREKYGW